MPYPLPLTRTEAYLAYKAGVIQQSDLKPSLAVPRNGIDAWLAYWTGLTTNYPVKNVGKNLFDKDTGIVSGYTYSAEGGLTTLQTASVQETYIPVSPNTAYTLHTSATASQTTNFRVFICEYTASKTFIQRDVPNPTTSNTNTITTTANTHYVRLCFSTVGIDTLQFEAGSNATAYESYTGEPLILQEEEAYIAYLCGVLDEYPEKCLRRVGAYLRYLISARWGRPDHPLNREELYLSLIKTQYIPSGDPSSDIVIDGTAKAPFVDVKMYGDTYQQSYTGKNLCNPATFVKGRLDNGVLGYASNTTSLTVEGNSITYTTNASYRGIVSAYIPVEPNTTYTLSRTVTSEITVSALIDVFESDSEASWITRLLTATFTTPSNCHYLRISFQNYASGTATISNIQVEKSSSTTSFEPYVGGVPSPNPDYPQPIQTVTGEQTVEVVGKNIIDYVTGLIASGGGITNTINSDGTITTVGKPNADYSKIIEYYDLTPYLEDGATYTLSSTLYDRKTAAQVRRTKISDSSVYNYDTLGGAKTFTVDKSQYKYRMGILTNTMAQWGDESLTITKGYQLEKSSTGTAFAPYSKHTYEINLGKNLFDIAAASDVWIHPSGIAQPNEVWKNSDFIKVEPNTTYTLSGSTIEGGFKQFQYHEYSSNNESSYINQYAQINWLNSITFTTHTGCNFIRVGYRKDSLKDIQLEAGSTATTYAPYKTPIELCKLGDYQDYIWKDGDDWKVHKVTGKVTLTGSEDWTRATTGTTGVYRFWTAVTDIQREIDAVGYANRLFKASGDTWSEDGISGSSFNRRIYIRYDSIIGTMTVEQLQTWLSTNNITAYYNLATKTDTTITNQALIAQLEALVAGGAENGTTYIKVNATDPNLPGLLYVEAPKYE